MAQMLFEPPPRASASLLIDLTILPPPIISKEPDEGPHDFGTLALQIIAQNRGRRELLGKRVIVPRLRRRFFSSLDEENEIKKMASYSLLIPAQRGSLRVAPAHLGGSFDSSLAADLLVVLELAVGFDHPVPIFLTFFLRGRERSYLGKIQFNTLGSSKH